MIYPELGIRSSGETIRSQLSMKIYESLITWQDIVSTSYENHNTERCIIILLYIAIRVSLNW